MYIEYTLRRQALVCGLPNDTRLAEEWLMLAFI